MKMEKPPPAKGLERVWRAFTYSLHGMRSCYRNEAAFRQESLLFVLLLPVLLFLPLSLEFKLILFAGNCLVLIAELLNSAIEAIVDKTSPEFHQLAKRAKDMGSAAVFLALVLAASVWAAALYQTFLS